MNPQATSTIELRSNRSGQPRAYLAGTRTRVQDVYVLSEIEGRTPDEIVAQLPHLTLGQVHAALSYYWDHRDAIHAEMAEDDAFVSEARRLLGPGPLERKLKGNDAGGNQVPS